MKQFSEKIKMLRVSKGMKQEELAAAIDTNRENVSRYELARTTPTLETLVKLSQVFNVTTDFLLKEDLSHNQNELLDLMNSYSILRPDEKLLVSNLVSMLINKK